MSFNHLSSLSSLSYSDTDTDGICDLSKKPKKNPQTSHLFCKFQIQKKKIKIKIKIFVFFYTVSYIARGKSYITQKLARYLRWSGFPTKIFNVGTYRRLRSSSSSSSTPKQVRSTTNKVPKQEEKESEEKQQQEEEEEKETTHDSAKFFDPNNKAAATIREQLALLALNDLLAYVTSDEGVVGVLDATNSTVKRRKLIYDRVEEERQRRDIDLDLVFIESICTDPTV